MSGRLYLNPGSSTSAGSPCQLGVRGADDAALAGGDVLDRMQREDGGACLAHHGVTAGRAERVRRVLDEMGVASGRDTPQVIEIKCGAGEVHRDDQASSLRDTSLDEARARHQSVPLDVCEHRRGAAQHYEVDGRDPRERRRNHLIARPDSKGVQQHVHAGGCRGHRDGMAATRGTGKRRLQIRDSRSSSEPSRPQHASDRGDVLLRERRPAQRQKRLLDSMSEHHLALP